MGAIRERGSFASWHPGPRPRPRRAKGTETGESLSCQAQPGPAHHCPFANAHSSSCPASHMGSRERGRLGAPLGPAPDGPATSDVQKGRPRSEEEKEVGGHPGLLSLLLPLPTAYLIISTSALLLPLTGLPAYPTWGGGTPSPRPQMISVTAFLSRRPGFKAAGHLSAPIPGHQADHGRLLGACTG